MVGEAEIAGALREALWLALLLGGPLLGATLAVGLVVSLLQAVTQISEPTLVFLPKVVVLVGLTALLGPYMQSHLTDFARGMVDRMVAVGGQ